MSGGNEGYRHCPYCGEEQPIQATVPWQADICDVCGNDVPETD